MKHRLVRIWTELPPAAGAAVMATGIISVGLDLIHQHVLSLVSMALASALWLVLAADFGWRIAGDRPRFRAQADTPPALTGVAATTVLGARLSMFGWQGVAAALLIIAALVWPGLLVAVIRHCTRPMPGAAFLVCVATQGLAVLAATLGTADHRSWLDRVAMGLFFLGGLLYLEALARFDFRQIRTGAGDQWVAGGALAICALTASKLTASGVWTGTAHTALRSTTLVLIGLALAWYVVLLAAELRWPRPHYDVRRWATVFPLGMAATACLTTSAATHVPWLQTLGQILLWIAVAAWALTLGALVLGGTEDQQA